MIAPFALLAFAGVALAQQQDGASSSVDPLNGSSFVTDHFTPSVTFTATSTYAQAGSRVPTVLSGVGPSLSTNAYAFSYDVPLSSVPATYPSALMESLASAGLPTVASDPLTPPLHNLQIVNDDGASAQSIATFSAVAIAGVLGAGLLFL